MRGEGGCCSSRVCVCGTLGVATPRLAALKGQAICENLVASDLKEAWKLLEV